MAVAGAVVGVVVMVSKGSGAVAVGAAHTVVREAQEAREAREAREGAL